MAAHARLSPSAAERWMTCPGSVLLTQDFPDNTSEYAAEGTVLHDVAADCLEFGFEPESYLGEVKSADGYSFEITHERVAMIMPHLDWLREQSGEVYVETRVDLGRWMPGQFGTLDVGIVDDDLITIADWKFGRDPVSAFQNKQLMIYAAGFWDNIARHLSQATRFRIIIMQPNARSACTEFFIDLDDLLTFMDDVQDAAVLTYQPGAPLKASSKGCKWCPLNPSIGGPGCTTMERHFLDLLKLEFEDLESPPLKVPSPSSLTPERMVVIWEHEGMIKKWLDAIAATLTLLAVRGEPAPGTKFVLGNEGHRKWSSPKEAEELLVEGLGEGAFTKSLKSPTQIEELIAPTKKKAAASQLWKDLQDLVIRDPGKPKLVSEADERPSLPSLKDEFEDLD